MPLHPGRLPRECATAVDNQGGEATARTRRAHGGLGGSWARLSGGWAGFGREEPPGSLGYPWKRPARPTTRTRGNPERRAGTD